MSYVSFDPGDAVMALCFALVDCNSFYAECERLFRPDLKHRPIIVLSNNDGCAVARCPRAKALGIKMGTPAFKMRGLLRQHCVAVFSSNYTLYADLSQRVMSVLEMMAPRVEVYSIDESFLDLTGVNNCVSLADFGMELRERVARWVGLPVCVGIGPTKTLAKAANYGAKQYRATGGVVDLSDPARQRRLLALMPVDEIWGVGSRLARRLTTMGIHTGLDLADADPALIRSHFSVVLERTLRELNGESCLELEPVSEAKQQILCSRSFGQAVTDKASMRQAVAQHVTRACEKLRLENRQTRRLDVFFRTNAFRSDDPQYTPGGSRALPCPTADTRRLLSEAIALVESLWREGYRYAKAGVMVSDLVEPGVFQPDLFEPNTESGDNEVLMHALDRINATGHGRV